MANERDDGTPPAVTVTRRQAGKTGLAGNHLRALHARWLAAVDVEPRWSTAPDMLDATLPPGKRWGQLRWPPEEFTVRGPGRLDLAMPDGKMHAEVRLMPPAARIAGAIAQLATTAEYYAHARAENCVDWAYRNELVEDQNAWLALLSPAEHAALAPVRAFISRLYRGDVPWAWTTPENQDVQPYRFEPGAGAIDARIVAADGTRYRKVWESDAADAGRAWPAEFVRRSGYPGVQPIHLVAEGKVGGPYSQWVAARLPHGYLAVQGERFEKAPLVYQLYETEPATYEWETESDGTVIVQGRDRYEKVWESGERHAVDLWKSQYLRLTNRPRVTDADLSETGLISWGEWRAAKLPGGYLVAWGERFEKAPDVFALFRLVTPADETVTFSTGGATTGRTKTRDRPQNPPFETPPADADQAELERLVARHFRLAWREGEDGRTVDQVLSSLAETCLRPVGRGSLQLVSNDVAVRLVPGRHRVYCRRKPAASTALYDKLDGEYVRCWGSDGSRDSQLVVEAFRRISGLDLTEAVRRHEAHSVFELLLTADDYVVVLSDRADDLIYRKVRAVPDGWSTLATRCRGYERAWIEDDATPGTEGHEGLDAAYRRLFGRERCEENVIAEKDGGDCNYVAMHHGEIVVSSYPGNSAIYVPVGWRSTGLDPAKGSGLPHREATLGPPTAVTLTIKGRVDWAALRLQKLWLLELPGPVPEEAQGLVNFVDAVQDAAVASGVPELEVFGPAEEGD